MLCEPQVNTHMLSVNTILLLFSQANNEILAFETMDDGWPNGGHGGPSLTSLSPQRLLFRFRFIFCVLLLTLLLLSSGRHQQRLRLKFMNALRIIQVKNSRHTDPLIKLASRRPRSLPFRYCSISRVKANNGKRSEMFITPHTAWPLP